MATGIKKERLANGQIWRWYERSTGQTIHVQAPWCFYDDFNYQASFETSPGPWSIAESTAAVDIVADKKGGRILAATTTASSDQKALAYWGNNRAIDLGATTTSKYVQFEVGFMLETGGGNDIGGHHICFLLGGDITANLADTNFMDAGGVHIGFDIGPGMTTASATEDFSIHCVSDDTGTDSDVDSGEDVTDGTYHILRCDASDKTALRFYLDGTEITPAGDFDISTLVDATESYVQPILGLYKHSVEGDGEAANLYIDYFMAWGIR